MRSNGSETSYPISSEWHQVRPWSLALYVKAITSVSVTFVLTSSRRTFTDDSEPSLALFGLSPNDEEDCEGNKSPIIVDALAQGITVRVNDTPWQRVLVHIDEQTDEAVVVIYGLMPGKSYEIDLRLLRDEHTETITGQITTEGQLPPAVLASTGDETVKHKRSNVRRRHLDLANITLTTRRTFLLPLSHHHRLHRTNLLPL